VDAVPEVQVVYVRHGELVLIGVVGGLLAFAEVAEAVEIGGVGCEREGLGDVVGGGAEVGRGGEVDAGREGEGVADDAVEADCGGDCFLEVFSYFFMLGGCWRGRLTETGGVETLGFAEEAVHFLHAV